MPNLVFSNSTAKLLNALVELTMGLTMAKPAFRD